VWFTADDERVCQTCGGVENKSVNMNDLFSIGVLLPPAHPSCRCAVVYEEVAESLHDKRMNEQIVNTTGRMYDILSPERG